LDEVGEVDVVRYEAVTVERLLKFIYPASP